MNGEELFSALDPIPLLQAIIISVITGLGKFILSILSKKNAKKSIAIWKHSKLLDKYSTMVKNIFYNILLSFFIYFLVGVTVIYIKVFIYNWEIDDVDNKIIFFYSVNFGTLLLSILRNKSRKAFKDLITHVTYHKLRCILYLVLPNLTLIFLVSISVYYTNAVFIVSFYVIFFGSLFTGISYFGAFQSYYKYDQIKIYFKNATPELICKRVHFIEEEYFISISNYDSDNIYQGTRKYNKSDIAIIEYLKRDIENLYQEVLLKRGFNE